MPEVYIQAYRRCPSPFAVIVVCYCCFSVDARFPLIQIAKMKHDHLETGGVTMADDSVALARAGKKEVMKVRSLSV